METSFLSSEARTGIATLKRFDTALRDTSLRLATGLKVNRASDNPSSFFTARALTQRAGDLNRAIDNIGNRIGAAQAAGAGVRALEQLVRVAQSVVDQAAAAPAPNPAATGTVNVSGEAAVTDLAGVTAGDRFTVQAGSDAATTITVSNGETPEELLAQLNAADNVEAAFTQDGELRISTTNGEALTLDDVNGNPLAGLGIAEGTFDETTAVSAERAAAAAAFDAVRTQIDQLAADASFLGVNLLEGDSPVIRFNADGSSSLTLQGADFSASGLGIAAAANGFRSDADVAAARDGLNGALRSLRGFSSRLSTSLAVTDVRREFAASLGNTLRSGADALTLADPNEEAASLLALQTRTGLATAGFSILQKSESGVLRLF